MGFYFGFPLARVERGVDLGENGYGAIRADPGLLQIGHGDPEPVADRLSLLIVLVDMVLEVVHRVDGRGQHRQELAVVPVVTRHRAAR